MYAIVRAGGRQEKVAVGDVLELDRVSGEAGESLTLPALLLVDGDTVTTDADDARRGHGDRRGRRADQGSRRSGILKYKNKTGYRSARVTARS